MTPRVKQMLDFQKLIPQIATFAEEASPDNDTSSQILSLAQASFEEATRDEAAFAELLKQNGGNTFWPTVIPLEDLAQFTSLSTFTEAHSVVACDGSQIMPTQHEIASCFLLNVGAVVLHYGEPSRAALNSYPHLFHRQEDLYPLINKRRIHIDESLVSFERGLKELQQARILAEQEQKAGHKVLTLIDGSLIPFGVDRNADRIQQELLDRYEVELDAFNAAALPLIGYISHSRSSDLINALRVWRCPYPDSRCQTYCGSMNEEDFPCSEIWPLSDRHLMASLVATNSRSAFFSAANHASMALRQRNRICFAYLKTPHEAARIEIPRWLFQDKGLLDFSLSALISQIQKGHGYPISLSEAHNLAVVRSADRTQFFQLLSANLMRTKQTPVAVSPKESRKRRGMV